MIQVAQLPCACEPEDPNPPEEPNQLTSYVPTVTYYDAYEHTLCQIIHNQCGFSDSMTCLTRLPFEQFDECDELGCCDV